MTPDDPSGRRGEPETIGKQIRGEQIAGERRVIFGVGVVWLLLGFWTAVTTLALIFFPPAPRREGAWGVADLVLDVAGLLLALWGTLTAWRARETADARTALLTYPGALWIAVGFALTRVLGGSPLVLAAVVGAVAWLAWTRRRVRSGAA